jgi:hypothetical protein
MGFIGGDLRQDFISRIRDADPGQLLAVPIDVGKHYGAAMVCDFWGEIVAPPLDFPLNERGFRDLAVVLARAEAERDASWVRVGLEQAGHYHRPLQARLEAHGLDVTLFNPAQVKANRDQDLLRSLKSDVIDLAAMAELLIRGKGRPSSGRDESIAIQATVAAHRSRKVKARTALKNQILPISISSSPDCRIALARCLAPSSAVCCRRGNDAGAGAAAGGGAPAPLLLRASGVGGGTGRNVENAKRLLERPRG